MTQIYCYDNKGYFICSQIALVDEKGKEVLEPNSTYKEPLPPKENCLVKFSEGNWSYEELEKETPEEPKTIEEQNEDIRLARQQAYVETSDSLYMDYQEALARGEATAEEKKQLWLASKDKIREENPYIGN